MSLEISGDSMAPVYRDGDRIVVSPAADVRRGDRVVVKTRKGEVMAKQVAAPHRAEAGAGLPQPAPSDTRAGHG